VRIRIPLKRPQADLAALENTGEEDEGIKHLFYHTLFNNCLSNCNIDGQKKAEEKKESEPE